MFRAQLNFFGSEKFGVVLAIGIILVGCGEFMKNYSKNKNLGFFVRR
jgi:hypothetical protein